MCVPCTIILALIILLEGQHISYNSLKIIKLYTYSCFQSVMSQVVAYGSGIFLPVSIVNSSTL